MSRVARLMIERLGRDNAERLAALVGGTRLSVPAQLANSARLRARIGDDLAVLVVLHFGGWGRVYVPRMGRCPEVDGRAVARLTKRNWSASRIARKLGCSERTVHAKRAETRLATTTKGPKS